MDLNRKIVELGEQFNKPVVRDLRRAFSGSGGRGLPPDHHGGQGL